MLEKERVLEVLNLVINGIPSIQNRCNWKCWVCEEWVLNLVINGIPSILNIVK